MDRQLSTAVRNAIKQRTTHIVIMAFLDFGPSQSDALFAHSSVGDISADLGLLPPFNGTRTYTGLGNLAGGYDAQEDTSDRPSDYELTLSGVDSELLQHARNLDHIGRTAKVFIGALDLATGELLGANEVKSGTMDRLEWTSGEVSVLEAYLQDERSKTLKGPGILYDDGQQRRRNANDGFCKAALFESKKVVSGPGANNLNDTNSSPPGYDEYNTGPHRNPWYRR